MEPENPSRGKDDISSIPCYDRGMKKESKNLGASKACPECRKTVIAAANAEGTGSFRTKCPHCGTLILVEIGQKTFFTLSRVAIAIVILAGSFGAARIYAEFQKYDCGSFPSRGAAQSAYEGNKIFYKDLDRDQDGRACQAYRYP